MFVGDNKNQEGRVYFDVSTVGWTLNKENFVFRLMTGLQKTIIFLQGLAWNNYRNWHILVKEI